MIAPHISKNYKHLCSFVSLMRTINYTSTSEIYLKNTGAKLLKQLYKYLFAKRDIWIYIYVHTYLNI